MVETYELTSFGSMSERYSFGVNADERGAAV